MHLITRPLLILLTLAALVIASLQVSGRILFWLLEDLEVAVNQYLWAQGIEVQGLKGEWHQLNPVVRIDRIELPAGYVEGVYVEVGIAESLWRSTPIARRFALADGHIEMEHTESGWRFKGGLGSFDFDLEDLILESDGIEISSRLAFSSDRGVGHLDLNYRAANRSGMHRHRLTLSNPDQDCLDDCALTLAFDGSDAILGVRDATRAATALSRGFEFPEALARLGAPRLEELDLRWRQSQERIGGVGTVNVSGIELAEGKDFGLGLLLRTRDVEDARLAQLHNVFVQRDGENTALPDFLLSFEEGLLNWWTPRLDLGAVLGFLGGALPDGSPGYRWLTGLQPRGVASNLRGYVDTEAGQMGYGATLQQIDLESFGGAPYMRGGGGELIGFGRGMQINLNAENMDTHWRNQFADNWLMGYAQGLLQAWFGPGYFAMRGLGMRLSVGESHASGGFALNRTPGQPQDDRLTLLINANRSTVDDARQFFPKRLPAGLPEWLDQGPRGGLLENIRFAYHGQIVVAPFELARRLEMSADISDGHVQYHPDWPEMFELDGFIEVIGRDVRFRVDEGLSSFGSEVGGTRLLLGNNASYADLVLSTQTTVDAALKFIRATPLQQWMSFVTPDWRGEGTITLDGNVHIPLKLDADHIGETSFEEEFSARLDIGLSDTDLSLVDYRIDLEALSGLVTYQYPTLIEANNVRGRILDQPARFGARSDDDTVIFSIGSQAGYQDVLTLLEADDPGLLSGGFRYLADLHIELDSDRRSRLEVVSDLTGLAIDLPGELGKEPDEAIAADLSLSFDDDYQRLSFAYGNARGLLHIGELPLRGSIGFGQPAPALLERNNDLLLTGQVAGFSIDEVIPDDSGSAGLLLPLRLEDLLTEYVAMDDLRFTDVLINGSVDESALSLVFESNSARGQVSYQGDDPLQLQLSYLHLPATDDGDRGDPLDSTIIDELPLADVSVDQFRVGDADYGAWRFALLPDANGVALQNLNANLRGVAIAADEVYWQRTPNQSRFKGTLVMADLAEVLPQWDIAPSLSTVSAEFSGDLHWAGSPANIDLDRLVGPATFVAKDGRFLEVDASGQGALRLFSLVNFSTVLKRLNLDFSDVRGEGIAFDEIRAETYFDEGTVTFTPEPMEINGSGSEFRVAGQVDLVTGTLDNEMIVTLPVTRSLPWYAAYIALANPLTAIGVLVGERVLRKPIEQFSSAKYTITGPIEDPELTFVNIWDRSVDKPQSVVEAPLLESPPVDSADIVEPAAESNPDQISKEDS